MAENFALFTELKIELSSFGTKNSNRIAKILAADSGILTQALMLTIIYLTREPMTRVYLVAGKYGFTKVAP